MTEALSHVGKRFDGKWVLRDVSLALPRGEIVCLLGTSGCGKSTVLRILAGLLAADCGEVHLPANACAMVFQEPRLLPWLTVAENLALALPFWQRRKDKAAAIANVLRQMQLPEVGRMMPGELSGGMAQRIGIARALLQRPEVLLMDEPFAALDAINRRHQQDYLREVVADRSCLFVTHDIDEALRIATHILVLAQGEIALRCDVRHAGEDIRDTILARLHDQQVFSQYYEDVP